MKFAIYTIYYFNLEKAGDFASCDRDNYALEKNDTLTYFYMQSRLYAAQRV